MNTIKLIYNLNLPNKSNETHLFPCNIHMKYKQHFLWSMFLDSDRPQSYPPLNICLYKFHLTRKVYPESTFLFQCHYQVLVGRGILKYVRDMSCRNLNIIRKTGNYFI